MFSFKRWKHKISAVNKGNKEIKTALVFFGFVLTVDEKFIGSAVEINTKQGTKVSFAKFYYFFSETKNQFAGSGGLCFL